MNYLAQNSKARSQDLTEGFLENDPFHPKLESKTLTSLDLAFYFSATYATLFLIYAAFRTVKYIRQSLQNRASSREQKKRRREFRAVQPTVDIFDLPAIRPRNDGSEFISEENTNVTAKKEAPSIEELRGKAREPKSEISADANDQTLNLNDDAITNIRPLTKDKLTDENEEEAPKLLDDLQTNPKRKGDA